VTEQIGAPTCSKGSQCFLQEWRQSLHTHASAKQTESDHMLVLDPNSSFVAVHVMTGQHNVIQRHSDHVWSLNCKLKC
jgi:hypothetical protein